MSKLNDDIYLFMITFLVQKRGKKHEHSLMYRSINNESWIFFCAEKNCLDNCGRFVTDIMTGGTWNLGTRVDGQVIIEKKITRILKARQNISPGRRSNTGGERFLMPKCIVIVVRGGLVDRRLWGFGNSKHCWTRRVSRSTAKGSAKRKQK